MTKTKNFTSCPASSVLEVSKIFEDMLDKATTPKTFQILKALIGVTYFLKKIQLLKGI